MRSLISSMSSDEIIAMKDYGIYFLDVVRGLKAEAERISKAFKRENPEILAMSISEGEIDGLRSFIKEPFEIEMSRYEELYAKHLSRFGDVFLPPPCFLAGLEEAEKAGIEISGIDMDDETHTTAYCALVSGFDLFRHTTRFNFIKLRKFRAESAAEFVIKWDRAVNNLPGFRELEREREKFIAKRLKKISEKGENILALIDVERANNVRLLLTESELK